ncbi:hypothetical protein FH972_023556 [Carpinus fangiana]|uniref:Protein FYV10 n=1 Tax=Carpinus fangiana TaxID=176857 RepID=A0A5N6KXS6_9ROSI|nr:hypothetical protein FH972_023556 [Carpinus fangiana]
MGTFNPDTQLILDQPLLKVPNELSRKNFKTTQRNVEHTRDNILNGIKNAAAPFEDSVSALDTMIAKMEGLKRKLSECHAEEVALQKASRARIEHINSLHSMQAVTDVKYDEWSKVRLNRLLVDYLLRSGYGDSAQALAKAENIEDLVDIKAFMQCEKIRTNLEQAKPQEALAWCQDNKQALKKMNSDLEFELRLQQYIEMIRTRQPSKLLDAAMHARKYLATSNSESATRAAALLAFPPGTPIEPYRALYSHERWNHLSSLFLRTHHDLLSLPARPALHVALSAGLSALKTPSCHSSHLSSSSNANTSSGTSVCPICSTELNELARSVPYANHTKSIVENDPVVLPNGRIYGRTRLMEFQSKMPALPEGRVRDPSEPDVIFDIYQVKKVYIS